MPSYSRSKQRLDSEIAFAIDHFAVDHRLDASAFGWRTASVKVKKVAEDHSESGPLVSAANPYQSALAPFADLSMVFRASSSVAPVPRCGCDRLSF